jgi:uncharacterized protein (TIGR02246 family)
MSAGWNLLVVPIVLFGVINSPAARASDESTIRQMVADAVRRLNQGDLTAIEEFWDEDADYVGIDGQFIHGRQAMRGLFAQLLKTGAGTEAATIEQVRFLSSDQAIVDGSWTISGAKGANGKVLPLLRGRGCEAVQKKRGRWHFVATREMVISGCLSNCC